MLGIKSVMNFLKFEAHLVILTIMTNIGAQKLHWRTNMVFSQI